MAQGGVKTASAPPPGARWMEQGAQRLLGRKKGVASMRKFGSSGLMIGASIVAVAAGILVACAHDKVGPVADASQAIPDRPDWNWDVRPILSQNCFFCHGQAAQKGGVRLDIEKAAYAEIAEDKGHRSVVPGNPGKSGSGSSGGGIGSFLGNLLKSFGSLFQQQKQAPTAPTNQVTVQLFAHPNPATRGASTTVSWTSTNATSCTLMDASTTALASGSPDSSYEFKAVSTTIFSVFCANQAGLSVTGSLLLNVQ